jgi:hypothetical protein
MLGSDLTEKCRTFLTAAFEDDVPSRVVVQVDSDIVDDSPETQPRGVGMGMLRKLVHGNFAHFCDSLMLAHDLHVLVVRFAVLADVLDGFVDLLLPEFRTGPSVLGRGVDLDVDIVKLI